MILQYVICPFVNVSICQNATFQLRYQNESCSKCHQEKVVKECESVCEKERESVFVCVCERERERERVRDRKSLRTAKEPALVIPTCSSRRGLEGEPRIGSNF